MRDVAFLVKSPEGATGIQRSRHLLEGIGPVFQYILRPSVSQAIKRGKKFAKEDDVKLLN